MSAADIAAVSEGTAARTRRAQYPVVGKATRDMIDRALAAEVFEPAKNGKPARTRPLSRRELRVVMAVDAEVSTFSRLKDVVYVKRIAERARVSYVETCRALRVLHDAGVLTYESADKRKQRSRISVLPPAGERRRALTVNSLDGRRLSTPLREEGLRESVVDLPPDGVRSSPSCETAADAAGGSRSSPTEAHLLDLVWDEFMPTPTNSKQRGIRAQATKHAIESLENTGFDPTSPEAADELRRQCVRQREIMSYEAWRCATEAAIVRNWAAPRPAPEPEPAPVEPTLEEVAEEERRAAERAKAQAEQDRKVRDALVDARSFSDLRKRFEVAA